MIEKAISTLLCVALLGAPAPLLAGGRGDAILGGAVGGALGAAIGSEVGGRDGAIVGGAIGGATGTALATQRYRRSSPYPVYVNRYRYVERPVFYNRGPHDYGPPPGYYRGRGQSDGRHRHRDYDDW